MNEVQGQESSGVVTKQTRRWVRLVCLSLLLMLLGFSAYLYHFRDRVTQSNFDKISEGMPLKDVYVLLGRKPDHVSKDLKMADAQRPFFPPGRFERHQWDSSELTIVVVVDDINRVVDRYDVQAQLQPWYIRLLNSVKRSLRLQ
jgi:hypothetical protein